MTPFTKGLMALLLIAPVTGVCVSVAQFRHREMSARDLRLRLWLYVSYGACIVVLAAS